MLFEVPGQPGLHQSETQIFAIDRYSADQPAVPVDVHDFDRYDSIEYLLASEISRDLGERLTRFRTIDPFDSDPHRIRSCHSHERVTINYATNANKNKLSATDKLSCRRGLRSGRRRRCYRNGKKEKAEQGD